MLLGQAMPIYSDLLVSHGELAERIRSRCSVGERPFERRKEEFSPAKREE